MVGYGASITENQFMGALRKLTFVEQNSPSQRYFK